MATTKETMKVIVIGIDNAEDEYEMSDVEELASEIVFEVAEKTAADFVLLAGESDSECTELILKLLSKKHFTSLAYALRAIFLAAGWVETVWRFNLLNKEFLIPLSVIENAYPVCYYEYEGHSQSDRPCFSNTEFLMDRVNIPDEAPGSATYYMGFAPEEYGTRLYEMEYYGDAVVRNALQFVSTLFMAIYWIWIAVKKRQLKRQREQKRNNEKPTK